jgi:hypothetical protein
MAGLAAGWTPFPVHYHEPRRERPTRNTRAVYVRSVDSGEQYARDATPSPGFCTRLRGCCSTSNQGALMSRALDSPGTQAGRRTGQARRRPDVLEDQRQRRVLGVGDRSARVFQQCGAIRSDVVRPRGRSATSGWSISRLPRRSGSPPTVNGSSQTSRTARMGSSDIWIYDLARRVSNEIYDRYGE